MIGEVFQWGSRGYGFVRPVGSDCEKGLFVHVGAFGGVAPEAGDLVEYTEFVGKDGSRFATNVKPLTAEQVEVARCLG